MKAQLPRFASPSGNPFNLLNVADLETGVLAMQFLHQQRDQYAPLRMRMDTAASAHIESCEKQRRAVRGFQVQRPAKILPGASGILGRAGSEDKHLGGLD